MDTQRFSHEKLGGVINKKKMLTPIQSFEKPYSIESQDEIQDVSLSRSEED